MPDSSNPIRELIKARCIELGLSRADLVRMCGYTNVSKGLRRLEALEDGNVSQTKVFLHALGGVLDVPDEAVRGAVQAKREADQAAIEAAYRAAFRPHAKILTERAIPTQITICVMTGGHLKLRIDFPPDMTSGEYPSFAMNEIRNRGGKKNFIPFFGTIEGFVVNYSPDEATVFSLAGEPIEFLDEAVRSAEAVVHLRGRMILAPNSANFQ